MSEINSMSETDRNFALSQYIAFCTHWSSEDSSKTSIDYWSFIMPEIGGPIWCIKATLQFPLKVCNFLLIMWLFCLIWSNQAYISDTKSAMDAAF